MFLASRGFQGKAKDRSARQGHSVWNTLFYWLFIYL